LIGAPDPAQRTSAVEPAEAWNTATRVGVAASILAHALLIGLIVFKLEWGGPLISVPTTIPVDLVPDPIAKDPEKGRKPPAAPAQHSAPPATETPAPSPSTPLKPPPSAATTVPDAGSAGSDLDAVRAQVQACWTIPPGWKNPKEVSVTIGFHLNADGTVAGQPAIIEFPATLVGKAAADNALRAAVKCGPYHVTSDKGGRDVQIRLSPTP
jgi:hypothetical protein